MKTWLANNLLTISITVVSVTFGYANFTADTKANAEAIKEHNSRFDKYEEKLDRAIKLLERIDERTKNL